MCRSAVGLPVLWLLLWVVLHLEMLLFPCGLQKMLWRKFCQRRPPAGEELWVLEQQEWCSPPPPMGGLTDPLTWSSMWGSSWGPQPPALCVGESLPPHQRELLWPCCPELLGRAGRAAGRLIKALCWSRGSCSCWLPRRRMAAGINASSPPAHPSQGAQLEVVGSSRKSFNASAVSALRWVWESPAQWCCVCQTLAFGGQRGVVGLSGDGAEFSPHAPPGPHVPPWGGGSTGHGCSGTVGSAGEAAWCSWGDARDAAGVVSSAMGPGDRVWGGSRLPGTPSPPPAPVVHCIRGPMGWWELVGAEVEWGHGSSGLVSLEASGPSWLVPKPPLSWVSWFEVWRA